MAGVAHSSTALQRILTARGKAWTSAAWITDPFPCIPVSRTLINPPTHAHHNPHHSSQSGPAHTRFRFPSALTLPLPRFNSQAPSAQRSTFAPCLWFWGRRKSGCPTEGSRPVSYVASPTAGHPSGVRFVQDTRSTPTFCTKFSEVKKSAVPRESLF